jgi:hypothetical protein
MSVDQLQFPIRQLECQEAAGESDFGLEGPQSFFLKVGMISPVQLMRHQITRSNSTMFFDSIANHHFHPSAGLGFAPDASSYLLEGLGCGFSLARSDSNICRTAASVTWPPVEAGVITGGAIGAEGAATPLWRSHQPRIVKPA